ncbi:MAG TPA: YkgJ family cysteine cluster protein [Fluviicola sp.]|nr:YkgJ family cysteine cluster protein [Fluviicola sp.]
MKHAYLLQQAVADKEVYKKLVQRLKKVNHRALDDLFHKEHEQAFKKMDCLTCANCCKTTSPIFRDVDIRRLSKRLRLSEAAFVKQYLRIDSDGDYVLTTAPCPFLGTDNYCSVYEDRPLACREYPHTDRKNMYQILDLTRKNMEVCPAVSQIMQTISKKTS